MNQVLDTLAKDKYTVAFLKACILLSVNATCGEQYFTKSQLAQPVGSSPGGLQQGKEWNHLRQPETTSAKERNTSPCQSVYRHATR